MMACRVVVRPGQPIAITTITITYIFLLSLFLKIIWNIKYLVSEGWKEDLIPLPFGSA
jgi:hypothetical protein